MIDFREVIETNEMIRSENLDVRTITMGISLLDCCHSDSDVMCRKVYDKITKDGTAIQGAVSLGYITEEQVNNYLNNLKQKEINDYGIMEKE